MQGGDTIASISAGLPNVSGYINTPFLLFNDWSGAFSRYGSNMHQFAEEKSAGLASGAQFDASLSNSIYGSSNTVQPPALSLIPQIKY